MKYMKTSLDSFRKEKPKTAAVMHSISMKTRTVLLVAAVAWLGLAQYAAAAGTAFTYQGRLDDTGQCADGNYDFQFTLYGAQTGGSVLFNHRPPPQTCW